MDNFQVYILDRNKNLVPVGIPGEIYISGDGLARGYLGNPALTAERFVENPFVRGERMYRTGDRARWYPKGDIEFLGRIDYQVKVRGYRIELGEIESRLLSHDAVLEAVVKDFRDDAGNTYLAAYVVATGELGGEALRAHLAESLPDYMLPSAFVFLDQMPLNNNGKADRGALEKPAESAGFTADCVPPENETEAVLADIWAGVLGLGQVGALDDYTSLGGDSLSAIRIITEIHKKLGTELSPKTVFQLRTVRRLACHIASLRGQTSEYRLIPRVADSPWYPVSSAQKRQYLLQELDGGVSYNLPGVLEIHGKPDPERMNAVFAAIVAQHESLRTKL